MNNTRSADYFICPGFRPEPDWVVWTKSGRVLGRFPTVQTAAEAFPYAQIER